MSPTERQKSKKEKAGLSLTTGSIPKGLILYAIPLLASGLIQQLYSTVDLIFVGQLLGTESAAAIGASDLLITCFVGFFNGMAVGSSVFAAQHFGGRRWDKLKSLIFTMFVTGLAGGILLLIAAQLFAPVFLRMMGTPEAIMKLAEAYLRIYILSMPGIVMYNLLSGVVRAIGDSRTPMLVQLFGGIVNVAADYLCIAALGMGVEGTAIATMLSQTFAAVCIVVYLMRLKAPYALSFKGSDFSLPELLHVLKVGVPSGIQAIIITFSNIIIQSQINRLGVESIASFTVYFKAEMLLYLPVLAIGQAAVAYIGQNYGAGDFERLKKGKRFCFLGGAGFTLAESLLLLALAPVIVSVFTRDPAVRSLSCRIMRTTYPLYFLCTMLEVLSSNLRGLGKALLPMIVVIISYCGFRLMLLFMLMAHSKTVGSVALCYPLSWAFAVFWMLIAVRYQERQINTGRV